LPTCHLRRSVPADEHPAAMNRDGRSGDGPSDPREAIDAVGVGTATETEVEYDAPALVVLGDVRIVSPADDEVPVGETLRVSLVDREDRRTVDDRADQSCLHVLAIEVEEDHARLVVPSWCRPVVEEADRAVRLTTRIVLPGEPYAGPERVVAAL